LNIYVHGSEIAFFLLFLCFSSPNGGKGAMSWIQYDTNGRIYLDFDVPITLKSFLKQDAVTLWSEIFHRIDLDVQKQDHDEL
jgi:hypothetical protein